MTHAAGNRLLSICAKCGSLSRRVRFSSCTPLAISARVNTPVPGPSSKIRPVTLEIPAVMIRARCAPEGTMAPTLRGARSHVRANPANSRAETGDEFMWGIAGRGGPVFPQTLQTRHWNFRNPSVLTPSPCRKSAAGGPVDGPGRKNLLAQVPAEFARISLSRTEACRAGQQQPAGSPFPPEGRPALRSEGRVG